MTKNIEYITHVENYEIKNYSNPVRTGNSDSWDWYSSQDILFSRQIEPLRVPLEKTTIQSASYFYAGKQGVDDHMRDHKILYPNSSTGVEVSTTREDVEYPDRLVSIMDNHFNPPLVPNQKYWFVRFSNTLQNDSDSSLLERESYHGNRGWRKSYNPIETATYECKHFTMAMRFEKWVPLQKPIFNGILCPFAIAFHNVNFLSKDEIIPNRVDENETERIQSSFRYIELPTENLLMLDVDNPLPSRAYGIYWKLQSKSVLDRHYPGQI